MPERQLRPIINQIIDEHGVAARRNPVGYILMRIAREEALMLARVDLDMVVRDHATAEQEVMRTRHGDDLRTERAPLYDKRMQCVLQSGAIPNDAHAAVMAREHVRAQHSLTDNATVAQCVLKPDGIGDRRLGPDFLDGPYR